MKQHGRSQIPYGSEVLDPLRGRRSTDSLIVQQLCLIKDLGPLLSGYGVTFAALGVEGLAPYWLEVEATAYVSVCVRD
jgi:hypothetical protein